MPSPSLSKISSASLADTARARIRKAILEGEIGPGERLTIEQLATELGISRTPVREAIKALEGDGILRILPNKGIVVQRFSRDELRERYAVRAMLEGYAAQEACARDAAGVADRLERNVEAMERKTQDFRAGADDFAQIAELLELNREFHAAILQASGCTMTMKILESLQGPVAYRLTQWRDAGRRQAILDQHRAVAAAFRSGDPARARAETERHVGEIGEYLLSIVKEPQEG